MLFPVIYFKSLTNSAAWTWTYLILISFILPTMRYFVHSPYFRFHAVLFRLGCRSMAIDSLAITYGSVLSGRFCFGARNYANHLRESELFLNKIDPCLGSQTETNTTVNNLKHFNFNIKSFRSFSIVFPRRPSIEDRLFSVIN